VHEAVHNKGSWTEHYYRKLLKIINTATVVS